MMINCKTRWTYEETLFVINNSETMSAEDIAKHLNRSKKSIYHKIARLNGNVKFKCNRFTEEETKYLQDNIESTSIKEMAIFLNKPYNSVYQKCDDLGLITNKATVKQFTKEEIDFLYKYANTLTPTEIAKHLGRNRRCINRKLKELNIHYKKYKRRSNHDDKI